MRLSGMQRSPRANFPRPDSVSAAFAAVADAIRLPSFFGEPREIMCDLSEQRRSTRIERLSEQAAM